MGDGCTFPEFSLFLSPFFSGQEHQKIAQTGNLFIALVIKGGVPGYLDFRLKTAKGLKGIPGYMNFGLKIAKGLEGGTFETKGWHI